MSAVGKVAGSCERPQLAHGGTTAFGRKRKVHFVAARAGKRTLRLYVCLRPVADIRLYRACPQNDLARRPAGSQTRRLPEQMNRALFHCFRDAEMRR
jgi:hypothetical protein